MERDEKSADGICGGGGCGKGSSPRGAGGPELKKEHIG